MLIRSLTLLVCTFVFSETKTFSSCDRFLCILLKDFPMINLHTWFSYFWKVFKCYWSWYNLTKSWSSGLSLTPCMLYKLHPDPDLVTFRKSKLWTFRKEDHIPKFTVWVKNSFSTNSMLFISNMAIFFWYSALNIPK